MIPKVFLSHASEDKERFVLKFAEKLRNRGIDVWLDRWEMYPGDSLIDKIFEEGLRNAQAVIVVLSHNSVNKHWVREELNAGMVKKINEGSKLIPVIIDDCEVPRCLLSTVWQKIRHVDDCEQELERIIMSIFGHIKKPTLGIPPKYVTTIIDRLPGLNEIDSLILKTACEIAIKKKYLTIGFEELNHCLKEFEIPNEEIHDSLVILAGRDYLKLSCVISGAILRLYISTYGFDEYLKIYLKNYDSLLKSIIFQILNTDLDDNRKLAENLQQPILIIGHLLKILNSRGLIKIGKNYNEEYIYVYYISPELKRAFR